MTAAVLVVVYESRAQLLEVIGKDDEKIGKLTVKNTVIALGLAALVIGGICSQFASGNPDGLEWSLFGNADGGYSENMGLDEEDYGIASSIADAAAGIQETTAFLPDYAFASDGENPVGTTVSGIIGSAIVAAFAAGICLAGGFFRRERR